jgi:hypothetical protein
MRCLAGFGGVVGVWDWFAGCEDVAEYLERMAGAVERAWRAASSPDVVAGRARALATKVREFADAHSDYGEGLILGCFVVVGDGMRVVALVARGEDEPRVEAVDVERWLDDFERKG